MWLFNCLVFDSYCYVVENQSNKTVKRYDNPSNAERNLERADELKFLYNLFSSSENSLTANIYF